MCNVQKCMRTGTGMQYINCVCIFFLSFLKLSVTLLVKLELLSVFFDQLSHKVLNWCVPAAQPYHNELGGEEEKKGAIMSGNCCLAHIQGSGYKEFSSMILKYLTCLKMNIYCSHEVLIC